MTKQLEGALDGYKILDMTSVVLGPYATQILGDLGADVVKLESPEGDIVRRTGFGPDPQFGSLFMTCNRNKRSIVLDLKHPESKPAMIALLKWADIFVHNVRPQAIHRLGFTYDYVKTLNPQIIYAHAVGYDSDGPYSGVAAYDDTVQAISGAAALMSHVDGNPQPRNIPNLIADKTTGLHLVYAVLAALLHRERSGIGQQIEVPMFESTVSYLMPENLGGAVWDPPGGPMGYPRTFHPYNRPLATKDGFLGFMPYTNQHWKDMLTLAGKAELFEEDPRLQDVTSRRTNMAEFGALLEEITQMYSTEEWCELLVKYDIPFMRVNTLESLLEDEHLSAVNFFESHTHAPTGETYRTMKHPVKFSETPASVRSHPPALGQDGWGVLVDVGMSKDDIANLVESGVLQGC